MNISYKKIFELVNKINNYLISYDGCAFSCVGFIRSGMAELRPCPFCKARIPIDSLLQHTLPCMEKIAAERPKKILEPDDKLPSETWSQYYQRKGSNSVYSSPPPQPISIPKKSYPPIPDYLKFLFSIFNF